MKPAAPMQLDVYRPALQRLERLLLLKRSLSLGELTMLTSCNLQDNDAVDRVPWAMSRWNDRIQQALLFDPNRLAPTYPASAITNPFPLTPSIRLMMLRRSMATGMHWKSLALITRALIWRPRCIHRQYWHWTTAMRHCAEIRVPDEAAGPTETWFQKSEAYRCALRNTDYPGGYWEDRGIIGSVGHQYPTIGTTKHQSSPS